MYLCVHIQRETEGKGIQSFKGKVITHIQRLKCQTNIRSHQQPQSQGAWNGIFQAQTQQSYLLRWTRKQQYLEIIKSMHDTQPGNSEMPKK